MSKLKRKEENHKHKHRSSSSSSSSSSCSSSDDSSSDSSDSSDDDSTRKHKKGPKYSHKDKHLPKNLYFTGEGKLTWDSFIFQFERIAHNREWSKKEKLNYFLDCLSEKALDYARKIKHKNKYRKLKKKMAERFDIKADPSVIRKEMFLVKLDSNETLEEFAQRVQFMAMDAHPGAKEETIQQISVEVSLEGFA